jgi:hypothetical protein
MGAQSLSSCGSAGFRHLICAQLRRPILGVCCPSAARAFARRWRCRRLKPSSGLRTQTPPYHGSSDAVPAGTRGHVSPANCSSEIVRPCPHVPFRSNASTTRRHAHRGAPGVSPSRALVKEAAATARSESPTGSGPARRGTARGSAPRSCLRATRAALGGRPTSRRVRRRSRRAGRRAGRP